VQVHMALTRGSFV